MVRLNNMRLERIIFNMEDNLRILDHTLKRITEFSDEMDVMMAKSSFRNGIVSIFTCAEDYLGMALKKVGTGIGERTFRECVNRCYGENLLPDYYKDFLLKNVKVRNASTHSYDVPSTEDLIEIYRDNRLLLFNFLDYLRSLNKDIRFKNSIKDSNLFK